MTLDPSDADRLASAIQSKVPLVRDPFGDLAGQLALDRSAVLEQLRAWKSEGKFREISAVLEGEALDHESALVATRVDPAELERVVAVVNGHPMVTHNYLRDHAFNLWFTIAAPRAMGLDRTLEALGAEAGGLALFPLVRTITFKIGVRFRLARRDNDTAAPGERTAIEPIAIDDRVRGFVRALQTPLPLSDDPFAAVAGPVGVDADELLAWGNAHLGRAVRRYGATFRHRELGVRGNGMAVWAVPEADLESVGERLAAVPQVSHCYARNTMPGFPYSLYSMIHAADEDEVSAIADRIAGEIGVSERAVLFSRQEFKKCRLRYFLPELDAWWNERCATVQ